MWDTPLELMKPMGPPCVDSCAKNKMKKFHVNEKERKRKRKRMKKKKKRKIEHKIFKDNFFDVFDFFQDSLCKIYFEFYRMLLLGFAVLLKRNHKMNKFEKR
jgi:hypothetical protein